MAANKDYIMHLLINPEDGRQLIRVYCRNADYISAAKFQIPISTNSIADYFGFPSFYFSYVVFRDERTINTTAMSDYQIVLNSQNYTLSEIYANKPIDVYIRI